MTTNTSTYGFKCPNCNGPAIIPAGDDPATGFEVEILCNCKEIINDVRIFPTADLAGYDIDWGDDDFDPPDFYEIPHA
jgi:hypothetical protein